jgi:hypothetical protein
MHVQFRRIAVFVLVLAGCGRPSTTPTPARTPLRFAAGDSVTVDTIAPDVMHYRVRRATGPFNIQIVTVPVSSRYELIAARAHDSGGGTGGRSG